jgi:hypothetical protein
MKKIVFILIFLFILLCCNETKHQVQIDEHYCKPDTVIGLYPDSSFFGRITCMQYHNNRIYALDNQRRDISVFSENFGSIFFIGSPGPGPGEFSDLCDPLYIHKDTLYVWDARKGINRFFKGKYIDRIRFPMSNNGRFACISGNCYFPYSTPSSTFAIASIDSILSSDFKYENLLYGGTPVKFDDEATTIRRNRRSLLLDSCYIYLLSENLPVIEKYDIKTLELLSSFDLSNIPIIQQSLKHAANLSIPPNAYYVHIRDGYIIDHTLYLLCVSPSQNIMSQILRISLYPEIKMSDILTLDGGHTTLCVTPDYIFTFMGEEYIARFKIPENYE